MEETGEFSFDPAGSTCRPGATTWSCAPSRACTPADGIAFRLSREIPLARGLGSSAAAIVAGLFAADHLFELALSKEEMLARATELEGHPDNVAAAIYGGFVICGRGGGRRADRRPLRRRRTGSRGSLVIPARGGLDRAGTRGDPGRDPARRRARQRLRRRPADARPAQRRPRPGRRAASRTASTSRAAATSTRARWSWSTRRRELGALGATISGAGPTVLVWTTWQDAGKVADALESRCEGWAEVRRLPFTPQGADVPEL